MQLFHARNEVSMIDRCKSDAYTVIQVGWIIIEQAWVHRASEHLASSVSTVSQSANHFSSILIQIYLVSLHDLRVYISHAVPTLLLLPD